MRSVSSSVSPRECRSIAVITGITPKCRQSNDLGQSFSNAYTCAGKSIESKIRQMKKEIETKNREREEIEKGSVEERLRSSEEESETLQAIRLGTNHYRVSEARQMWLMLKAAATTAAAAENSQTERIPLHCKYWKHRSRLTQLRKRR